MGHLIAPRLLSQATFTVTQIPMCWFVISFQLKICFLTHIAWGATGFNWRGHSETGKPSQEKCPAHQTAPEPAQIHPGTAPVLPVEMWTSIHICATLHGAGTSSWVVTVFVTQVAPPDWVCADIPTHSSWPAETQREQRDHISVQWLLPQECQLQFKKRWQVLLSLWTFLLLGWVKWGQFSFKFCQ